MSSLLQTVNTINKNVDSLLREDCCKELNQKLDNIGIAVNNENKNIESLAATTTQLYGIVKTIVTALQAITTSVGAIGDNQLAFQFEITKLQTSVDEILGILQGQLLTFDTQFTDSTGNPLSSNSIQDNQTITGAAYETDSMGNKTPLDLTQYGITWSAGDNTLLTVTQNSDGTASVAAVGPLGKTTVVATITSKSTGTVNTVPTTFNIVAGPATGLIVTNSQG